MRRDPPAGGAAGAPERLLAPLQTFGIRLGLETITAMLERLGRPQDRFASVLVAGTNGKGSTAALLAAMATAAGYRTGLYTSPHLERVTERIRIDGHAVGDRELGAELRRVLAAAALDGAAPPTYFEAVTAAGLARFARRGVELAVLEVGLGGRLDATNAVSPELSVICDIARDHERHLGASLAAIAAEKAGVLRPGRPALCRSGPPEVASALKGCARRLGADLELVGGRGAPEPRGSSSGDGARVVVRTPRARYQLRPRLAGEHQRRNLVLALRAAEVLAGHGWQRLDGRAVAAGVAACRWPGRLERVALPGGRTVLLDAAHNPSGARALARYLASCGAPYRLLFGALEEKRVEEMLPLLAAGATDVVLTAPSWGRPCPLERLSSLARGRVVAREPESAAALRAALRGAPRLLVVSGSLYLVGEVRSRLRGLYGVPEPATEPLF